MTHVQPIVDRSFLVLIGRLHYDMAALESDAFLNCLRSNPDSGALANWILNGFAHTFYQVCSIG